MPHSFVTWLPLLILVLFVVERASSDSKCVNGEYEEVHTLKGTFCRYVYDGVYSIGNQLRGEFGTGAYSHEPNTIVRQDDRNRIVVGGTGKIFITDTGDAWEFSVEAQKYKLIPTRFEVMSAFVDKFSYLISTEGKLYSLDQNYLVRVPLNFTIKHSMGRLVLTDDNLIYEWNDQQQPTFQLVMNASMYTNGVPVSQVIDSNTKKALHYAMLLSNGSVLLWGSNEFHTLGDGTYIDSTVPKAPLTSTLGVKIVSVSLGQRFTIVLSDTGRVFFWGQIYPCQTTARLPTEIELKEPVTSISTGETYVHLMTKSGAVYGLGYNGNGNLADGSKISRNVPVILPTSIKNKVRYVTTNYGQASITYLVYDTYIEAWGNVNPSYIVAKIDRTFKPVSTITAMPGRVKHIEYGNIFNAMLTEEGRVFTAGANLLGQIGDGTNDETGSYIPYEVNMYGVLLGKTIESIHAVYTGVLAITTDGDLVGWGGLGSCSTQTNLVPIKMQTNNVTMKEALYNSGTYMLSTNGSLYECIDSKIVRINSNPKYSPIASIHDLDNIGDNGFYIVSKSGKVVLVDVPTLLAPIINEELFYGVADNFTIDGTLKEELFKGFTMKDITKLLLWQFNDETFLIAICNDGRMFRGDTEWVPFFKNERANPDVTSSNVLVTQNGTIFEYRHTFFNNFSLHDSGHLRKVLSITKTAAGVTGVFARCSEYFSGYDCALPVCYGFNSSHPSVCSGHGMCVAPGKCECMPGHAGDTCDFRDCGYFLSGSDCKLPSDLTYGLIGVAIFLVFVIAFVLFSVLVLCIVKYRKVVVKQHQAELEMKNLLNESLLRADSLAERVDRDWVIPFGDLKFEERISEGAFGIVMKGKYQNLEVAIKILKEYNSEETDLVSFENEVKILRSLRHPNIVLFMGVAINEQGTTRNRLIVTEYMPGRSLDTLLYSGVMRGSIRNLHNAVPFRRKLDLLLDVVKGMLYLHNLTPPIVHRDLKPNNILLDRTLQVCKVCDFGTATAVSVLTNITGNMGTILYMSPEVLLNRVEQATSTKVDIYSFGIIMHEIFFERMPYNEENYDSIITLGTEVVAGKRPKIPEYIYTRVTKPELDYIELMKECWNGIAAERPSFEQVFSSLMNIIDKM